MATTPTACAGAVNHPRFMLRNFRSPIEGERNSYRVEIGTLPSPLGDLVRRHFEDRIERAGDDALLGEALPWIIADLLHLSPSKHLKKLAGGWLQLYFSVMLLDDIIDESARIDFGPSLIAASLLQQRGTCQLLCNAVDPDKLAMVIRSAFDHTAVAATEEVTAHRGRLSGFDSTDLRSVGRKLALVRVCIEAVSQTADTRADHSLRLFAIFDDLMIAFQLLDDLSDWPEDAGILSMTFPLTLAAERVPHAMKLFKEDQSEQKWAVFLTLIQTGALRETLQTALDNLECAQGKLNGYENGEASRFGEYVQTLILASREILELLKTHEPMFQRVKPRDALQDQKLLYTMKTIRRELTVVAQSS